MRTTRHTCKSRLAIRLDCEYGWKCQRAHKDTLVRLKQIELALFTFCDAGFVFCEVTAEISAQIMVRRRITRSICRIGPVVGIGLPVGSILVVSSTYEPQHYKTNKMTCPPSEDSDQPGHPPSLIKSLRSARNE